MSSPAYINRIATAVPPNDINAKFSDYAPRLLSDERARNLLQRMAAKTGIEHRYSVLPASTVPEELDAEGFYRTGHFPGTKARMLAYERHALGLAVLAVDKLEMEPLPPVTHLILTSCTGFYAPGLDIQIVRHYALSPSVERNIIGFMGCYAAINALKLAHHIVRSEPQAGVLLVNLELCSLHLTDHDDLTTLLPYLIFADGCAASFISARPQGLEIQSFHSTLLEQSAEEIRWHIGNQGFEMFLSGQVPNIIGEQLPAQIEQIVGSSDVKHWAVHSGGRSVLDAIEKALQLPPEALRHSRATLRDYGNMSSATVMFVLKRILEEKPGGPGCALAFGPGLTSESMTFRVSEA